ncbi:Hypothetical predicted protein [Olea europaea subsp. europaea]|uniref:Uncharacterized protein n=1 Tax=Olea europaea subsp. europaea TaxID=158383 RepID=A0A8S0RZT0_OLEEU|nr:Hypothetical predicted protein [Olea europaea subsp. europaea]
MGHSQCGFGTNSYAVRSKRETISARLGVGSAHAASVSTENVSLFRRGKQFAAMGVGSARAASVSVENVSFFLGKYKWAWGNLKLQVL